MWSESLLAMSTTEFWDLITLWQVLEITPIFDVLIWTPIISCLGNLTVP